MFVSKWSLISVSVLLVDLDMSCFCTMYSVALHPEKQVLATASDDRTWKLWSIPSGELILTGHGHSDWVSGCDFHPTYVAIIASKVSAGLLKVFCQ